MTTIQISDPWFENLYNREFEANATKFIETIKTLLVEKYQKEKRFSPFWLNIILIL